MNSIEKIYRGFLSNLKLVVRPDGAIFTVHDEPFSTNHITLAMPVDGEVRKDCVLFNPAQDIGLDVHMVKKIQERMAASVNSHLLALFLGCLTVCVDQDRRKKLNNKANQFLSGMGSIDENTLTFFTKFLTNWKSKYSTSEMFSLAKFSVQSNRTIGGVPYTRVGVYTCPIYDYFRADESSRKRNENFSLSNSYKFMGVACRKSDVEVVRGFFHSVFSQLNVDIDKSQWAVGTKNNFGNTFFSLTGIYLKIIKRIHECQKWIGAYQKEDNSDIEPLDITWEEEIENAMKDRNAIDNFARKTSSPQQTTSVVQNTTVKSASPPTNASPVKRKTLDDLLKEDQVNRGTSGYTTENSLGKVGRVVRLSDGDYAQIGDRLEKISPSSHAQQAPVRTPTMIGNPERQGNQYVGRFDDGVMRAVEYENGRWVPVGGIHTQNQRVIPRGELGRNTGYPDNNLYYPQRQNQHGQAQYSQNVLTRNDLNRMNAQNGGGNYTSDVYN